MLNKKELPQYSKKKELPQYSKKKLPQYNNEKNQ